MHHEAFYNVNYSILRFDCLIVRSQFELYLNNEKIVCVSYMCICR